MLFIGVLRHLQLSWDERHFKFLSLGILVVSLMAIFHQTFYHTMRHSHQSNYIDNIEKIKSDFRNVEAGSVVIFGDNHLNYLRPDISITSPKYLPYHEKAEAFDAFLTRLHPDKHVYLKIPSEVNPTRYHKSVIELLSKYQAGDILKIR